MVYTFRVRSSFRSSFSYFVAIMLCRVRLTIQPFSGSAIWKQMEWIRIHDGGGVGGSAGNAVGGNGVTDEANIGYGKLCDAPKQFERSESKKPNKNICAPCLVIIILELNRIMGIIKQIKFAWCRPYGVPVCRSLVTLCMLLVLSCRWSFLEMARNNLKYC